MLKENEQKWVDCFKKSSNLDSKIKDKECEKVPFMSDSLLKLIHQKGNIRCSLRYLDYLTIKCNVKERRLHTELGCLYVQYITRLLNKYKVESSQKEEAPEPEKPKEDGEAKQLENSDKVNCPYNLEEARSDQFLIDLRNRLRVFLSTSLLYEPNSIL